MFTDWIDGGGDIVLVGRLGLEWFISGYGGWVLSVISCCLVLSLKRWILEGMWFRCRWL